MTKTSETAPIYTRATYIQTVNGEHITATNMTINPTDCDEPCSATVTVTWKNSGQGSGKFKPAIKVNGIKNELEEITLKRNQTITKTFNLINLMEGTYTICPYPN